MAKFMEWSMTNFGSFMIIKVSHKGEFEYIFGG